jgi:hypothetical protein
LFNSPRVKLHARNVMENSNNAQLLWGINRRIRVELIRQAEKVSGTVDLLLCFSFSGCFCAQLKVFTQTTPTLFEWELYLCGFL